MWKDWSKVARLKISRLLLQKKSPKPKATLDLIFDMDLDQLHLWTCSLLTIPMLMIASCIISFASGDSTEALNGLQSCLASVKSWMSTNKLNLNPDKTEFLLIGNEWQRSKYLSMYWRHWPHQGTAYSELTGHLELTLVTNSSPFTRSAPPLRSLQ